MKEISRDFDGDFEASLKLVEEEVSRRINSRLQQINATMYNMDIHASQDILDEYKNDVALCKSIRLLIEKYRGGQSMLPYYEQLQGVTAHSAKPRAKHHDKVPKKKAPTTRLRVTFHNPHKVIQEKFADDTLIEAIKYIGVDKILEGNFTIAGNLLISSEAHKYRKACDRYFVFTHCRNELKVKVLQDIKKKLDIGMTVELIPCNEANVIEFPLFKDGS